MKKINNMKKHTNLLNEIYQGKKPDLFWFDTALVVVTIIAVCFFILAAVAVLEAVVIVNG